MVFDIGANIGEVSKQFLDAGAERVIAVEACHENYSQLYAVKGVTPVHAAAWNCATIVPVSYEPQGHGVWSSCIPQQWARAVPAARFKPPQYVPTVTLDGLIQVFGKPNLIKVDVEGVEPTVLTGLSCKVDFLMFEFNQTFPLQAIVCLDLLAKLGYTKASYIEDNLDLTTVPEIPIEETLKKWQTKKPFWGMFTVA